MAHNRVEEAAREHVVLRLLREFTHFFALILWLRGAGLRGRVCRSPAGSVSAPGLLGNRLLLAGVAVEIALIVLIDYTAWGNAIFGTSPIAAGVWLYVIPFAFTMLAREEVRKWIFRSGRSWPQAGRDNR